MYDESRYLSGSDVPQWKYPGGLAVGDSRLASYIIHYPTDTDTEDIVYALVDAKSGQYYLRREMLNRQADSITVGPYTLPE